MRQAQFGSFFLFKEGNQDVKPWLFAILRNVCRVEFGRRSRVLLYDVNAEPDQPEGTVPLWREEQDNPETEMLRKLDAQAIQEIEIVGAGEPDSCRTLETTPIFPTDAEPVGQRPVELGDGKQPIQGITVSGRVRCTGRARICARSRIHIQVSNGLSIDALPNYTRNKRENQYDTSSHCNLFNTEWGRNRGTIRN